MIKRDKKGGKNKYRIKAEIGRSKNHDLYNIIKVIQHPEYQKMSSQQVVKYQVTQQSTQISSGFLILFFFVMKGATVYLVEKP